jgi:hypothetical protein
MAVADIEQHPADLMAQAEELERKAEEEMLLVRQWRAEAARLRSRAERINHGTGVTVTRKPEKEDPLLAAAALAAENLPGKWTSAELGKALAITDSNRALRLCVKLRDLGHVEQVDGMFRSVDPEAARIRDAVIELGEFTREQLAQVVSLCPEALTWYLADLRARGIIAGGDLERMAYQPTGRENVVTRRFRRPTPEQEVGGTEKVERGEVVEFTGKPMIESGGNRRRAGERKSRGGNVRKQKHKGR